MYADCLFMEAGLVAADRLYTAKREVLEQLGLGKCCKRSGGYSISALSQHVWHDCNFFPLFGGQVLRRTFQFLRTALPPSTLSTCG